VRRLRRGAALLAAASVAVGVETVVVFAHHRHVARVLRAVAAAAFAVVVVGGGIEASAGVVGIAFAGFFFFGGCFFDFGFFGDQGFRFGCFRLTALGCCGSHLGPMPARYHLSSMAGRGPSLLPHLGMANRGPVAFHLCRPRLLVPTPSRVFTVAAAAHQQQGNQDYDE
jgi:hypothetical protein